MKQYIYPRNQTNYGEQLELELGLKFIIMFANSSEVLYS